MPNKDNHIYDKQTRTWFDVTPEQFQEYDRWRTRIRKREQAHGHCMCPRSKWWLCDGMCQDCEFHAAGDTISLDAPVANDDGDEVSLGDTLMDPDSLFDSIFCDKAEMDMLFARLEELMPEAMGIGLLRQKGLTDSAIADSIGVKRTTFLSRLKKAREQLASEFPDLFYSTRFRLPIWWPEVFQKKFIHLRQTAYLASSGKCKEQTPSRSGLEVNDMYEARNKSPADTEVIDVLIAISQVSARLARKLTILAAQRQSEEGGKHREQNERYGRDHRRAAQCCYRY